jgi:hypothetical protein
LLKHHIPIKTDSWDVKTPGFTEIDLVSHSGNSASGEFLHSLNVTDIHSTWVESRAVMGKSQIAVLNAMQEIEQALPFKLLGIDSDNGSEFINYHLKTFCDQNNIQLTRGRPYKKDDNAHIEQKNYTHVRKILGYLRYDSGPAQKAINELYQNELRILQNLFLPAMKLIKKTRVGSKLKRSYDKAQTPLERLLVCSQADPVKVQQLKRLREQTDPLSWPNASSKNLSASLTWPTSVSARNRKISISNPRLVVKNRPSVRSLRFLQLNARNDPMQPIDLDIMKAKSGRQPKSSRLRPPAQNPVDRGDVWVRVKTSTLILGQMWKNF